MTHKQLQGNAFDMTSYLGGGLGASVCSPRENGTITTIPGVTPFPNSGAGHDLLPSADGFHVATAARLLGKLQHAAQLTCQPKARSTHQAPRGKDTSRFFDDQHVLVVPSHPVP